LLALFGVSLINAAFFGCTMRPATDIVQTGGWGSVACYSGLEDGVTAVACSFKYTNLTSVPTVVHFHVGNDTMDGPVTFDFDPSGIITAGAASGTAYQKIKAANSAQPQWIQRNGLSFADQITSCASGAGCYFNLHTSFYPNGELRCQAHTLTTTYSYLSQPLVAAPGAVGAENSTGLANVEMATITPAAAVAVHAWGYQVAFDLSSPVSNAHIHQGTSFTDNQGPVKVKFDQGSQRTVGSFVGVALEGVTATQQPNSNWPTYAADFDTALGNHFGYVNVHTVANGGGEVRANIAPGGTTGSGVSQVSLAALAIVFMFASWMSL